MTGVRRLRPLSSARCAELVDWLRARSTWRDEFGGCNCEMFDEIADAMESLIRNEGLELAARMLDQYADMLADPHSSVAAAYRARAREFRSLAQGIEARQGGDSEASSIGDESPAGEAGVPNG